MSSLQLRSCPSLWCDHSCTRESNSTYLLVSGPWSIFRTWPTEAQAQDTSCGTYQKGEVVNMGPRTDHRALVSERGFQSYPHTSETLDKSQIDCTFYVSTMSVCPGYFCLMLNSGAFKNPPWGHRTEACRCHSTFLHLWVLDSFQLEEVLTNCLEVRGSPQVKGKRCAGLPMPVTARPRLWGRTLRTWHYMHVTYPGNLMGHRAAERKKMGLQTESSQNHSGHTVSKQ